MKVRISRKEPMFLEHIKDLVMEELQELGFKCRLSAVVTDVGGHQVSCQQLAGHAHHSLHAGSTATSCCNFPGKVFLIAHTSCTFSENSPARLTCSDCGHSLANSGAQSAGLHHRHSSFCLCCPQTDLLTLLISEKHFSCSCHSAAGNQYFQVQSIFQSDSTGDYVDLSRSRLHSQLQLSWCHEI